MKFLSILIGFLSLIPSLLHAQLTAFENGGKWGFKDEKGNVVVPAKYAGVGHNGLAQDLDGKVRDIFSEGLSPVTMQGAPTGLLNTIEGGKWGFMDATGKEVTPLKYDEVEEFKGGYAVVTLGGKQGLLSKTGKEVIPPRYEKVHASFSDGLAAVERDGLWGFVDASGKEVIPPKYYQVFPFSEGLAAVAPEEPKSTMAGVPAFAKYGFINKSARMVIPVGLGAPHEMMGLLEKMCFDGGQVQVLKGTETVYIDTKGAVVPPSLKHRLFELYADSHNGFKKRLSDKRLESDAARKLDYYAVINPAVAAGTPGVTEAFAVSGDRKLYVLNYNRKTATAADEALSAMKALANALETKGWYLTPYYKDYGGDAEGNTVIKMVQRAPNGLLDPRTQTIKLTEGENKVELVIVGR